MVCTPIQWIKWAKLERETCSFNGQVNATCPSKDRGIPTERKHVATAQLQRAVEDFKGCARVMIIVGKSQSGDRKRRRIVIAERDRDTRVANRSNPILFTQSAATKARMIAPSQIRMCRTVIGLKVQGLFEPGNCPCGFVRHSCENELLRSQEEIVCTEIARPLALHA